MFSLATRPLPALAGRGLAVKDVLYGMQARGQDFLREGAPLVMSHLGGGGGGGGLEAC